MYNRNCFQSISIRQQPLTLNSPLPLILFKEHREHRQQERLTQTGMEKDKNGVLLQVLMTVLTLPAKHPTSKETLNEEL